MAHKLGFISYTLATIASICFVSGIIVLSGGENNDVRKTGDVHINDRQYA